MASKTVNDPSGQRVNRRKATTGLVQRLKRAKRKVIEQFAAIPFKRKAEKIIVNESLVFYIYDRTPEHMDMLRLSIQSHIDAELGTYQQTMPLDWWFKKDIELPYRQGTLESVTEFNQLLNEAEVAELIPKGVPVLPAQPQAILFSQTYLDGLRSAYAENYGLIKTMGADTAQQTYRVINDGMKSGLSPSQIKNDIVDRFNVSESNAKRIADTEVNRAYNDARLRSVSMLADESPIEVAVMHISSLLATTRPSHADRHKNIYTASQQERWWNDGANRINCKCTTRSVLLDKSGNIVKSELQKKIRKDMRNVV